MITSTAAAAEVAGNLKIGATTDAYTKFKVYEKLDNIQTDILNTFSKEWLISARKSVLKAVTTDPLHQWPGDMLRFVAAFFSRAVIDNSNRGTPCSEYTPGHAMTMAELATDAFPYIDPHKDNGYEIRPNGDNFYHRIEYIWRLPTITSTQPSLLDLRWKDLLVLGATGQCANVDNYRPAMAQAFTAEYIAKKAQYLPMKEK